MRSRQFRSTAASILLLALCAAVSTAAVQREIADNRHYRKWLDEDVFWIITDEEYAVFAKLSTDEERDAFIEQFWLRRDPDPATMENEYKIEHYRRIVYANEHFHAGIDGWKSDRGMIYIKFGPPDRKETYPGGGPYARERKEGGGMTAVFPFERWEYRNLPGIGDDVVLEFVDDKGGGQYELTWDNQRKDALLLSGLMGLTQDELEQEANTGYTNKQDRVARRRYSGEYKGIYSGMGGFESHRDKPFEQLILSAGISRPLSIRFKDLETAVSARVTYTGFPFDVRQDFIRITDQQVLVPITVLLANEHLTFKRSYGLHHGAAQIYGRVVGLGNRIEAIFEDEVARDFPPDEFERAKRHASIYQKRLILKPGLYKLELAVKDVESGRIGMTERRLEVPKYADGSLQLSSLILADRIEPDTEDRSLSSFILGDLKVIPKTDDAFRRTASLGLYLQIYNFALDQETQRPALKLEYAIAPRGSEPESWRDVSQLVHFAGQHCRFARMINLSRLEEGLHELRVRVTDAVSGRKVERIAVFRVTP